MLSHIKLDLNFFFMAGPKNAKQPLSNSTHLRPKSPRKLMYVRLLAVTCTSPKVGVAASKLVPRKEKLGPRGLKDVQNNLSLLVLIG